MESEMKRILDRMFSWEFIGYTRSNGDVLSYADKESYETYQACSVFLDIAISIRNVIDADSTANISCKKYDFTEFGSYNFCDDFEKMKKIEINDKTINIAKESIQKLKQKFNLADIYENYCINVGYHKDRQKVKYNLKSAYNMCLRYVSVAIFFGIENDVLIENALKVASLIDEEEIYEDRNLLEKTIKMFELSFEKVKLMLENFIVAELLEPKDCGFPKHFCGDEHNYSSHRFYLANKLINQYCIKNEKIKERLRATIKETEEMINGKEYYDIRYLGILNIVSISKKLGMLEATKGLAQIYLCDQVGTYNSSSSNILGLAESCNMVECVTEIAKEKVAEIIKNGKERVGLTVSQCVEKIVENYKGAKFTAGPMQHHTPEEYMVGMSQDLIENYNLNIDDLYKYLTGKI